MEIIKLQDFWLFVLAFLPGFISVKIHNLIIADEKYDFSKNLLEIIGFSLLNFILFCWLIALNIYFDWIFLQNFWFYLSIFLIFIVGPVFWPILTNKILRSKYLKKHVVSSSKSAWDYVFQQRKPSWILVHLKDGRKIGGKFGANSYASPYPCKENIYIEEVWALGSNSEFLNKIDRTGGVLILSDDVFALEFFK